MPLYVRQLPCQISELVNNASIPQNQVLLNPSTSGDFLYIRLNMHTPTEENNHMLKGQRRAAFVGNIFKIVWWALILVILPYFTWLYLQPYLDTIMGQYQTVQEKGTAIKTQTQGLQTQISGLTDLLKEFGIGAK